MSETISAATSVGNARSISAAGIGGFRRAELIAFAIIAAALVVSLVVQATSIQLDASFDRIALDWRTPWILEGTSHLTLLLLAAGVPIVLRAAPIAYPGIGRAFLVHLLAAVAFSFLHVAGMFLLRETLFPAILGRPYELNFFDAKVIVYELRKDLFTYGLLLFGFWAIGAMQDRIDAGAPAAANRRIALFCGKRSLYLDPEDIVFVKSAGNYIEVATAAKTHLVRMTISRLEEELDAIGAPHVRVHRSYLVNPAEIRELVPTGDGGVSIILKSGAEIPGSRSYRQKLDTLMARERPDRP